MYQPFLTSIKNYKIPTKEITKKESFANTLHWAGVKKSFLE
jgi:hypothetical protein